SAPSAAAQAQVEFSGSAQPLPLPLVGEAQPVIREPLAQASGMEDEQGATTDLPPVQDAPVVPTVASAPVPTPIPVQVAPVVKPKTEQEVAKTAPGVGADWYASRPAGNYAMQILGTRAENSAKAFVGKLGADYRYFKKLHQGQPLYVVSFGQFSGRSAAQA